VKSDNSTQLSAERWEQVNQIVADALEQKSPIARAALVAERCGNDLELLREVKSLLDQTTDSLESFAESATESLRREMSILSPGRRIGAYAIVRELGRGGMGAVYLAQRADGAFEKQVAIKVLKRGTDTDEVLRRFQSERKILARLNHPNIARLLDAGTTDDGLPYFVMDYVDGKPITKYANEHRSSVTQRLNLFRAVCSAVSYAHQNLIIHRDLKPSNVLVTNEGEVKLLDFGIAKLMQEAEAEQQQVTVTLLRVMTPEYASPEQVKGEPVTTVSDVYSLGVFLYELLTGERPYKLKRRTPDEITKAICEQEPERPSTAIAKGAGNSKSQIPSSKLLRGDLDNIVLKALRKEPERRYLSVDQLSGDIRRHLEDLPVRARKDTFSYRASKFIQRHKLGVAAAGLVALALVGGSITTAWQAHQARLEKVLADQRFNDVRELAHSLLFDYHDEIAALPGSTKVRERLVKDSLQYLDRLSKQPGNDIALLREIGWAYQRIGEIQGGTATFRTGGTMTMSSIGDLRGALESYRRALKIREQLAQLQPASADIQQELGTSITRMAEISLTLGKPTDAANYCRKAIDVYDRLFATHPSDEAIRAKAKGLPFVLAKALGTPGGAHRGKLSEALAYLRTVLADFSALAKEFPSEPKYRQAVAAEYNQIGRILSDQAKPVEALESHRKAQALDEALVAGNGTNALYRRELGVTDGIIGNALLALGKNLEAIESCRASVSILESVSEADPGDANVRRDLAVSYGNLGNGLASINNRAAATTNFDKAVKILEELMAKDSSNALVSYQLSLINLKMSHFLSDAGDISLAMVKAQQAAKIGETLAAIDSNNASARAALALADFQLGRCSALLASSKDLSVDQQTAHWREAKGWYQKSLNSWQDLKIKGTLSPVDAGRPEELTREIASCDAALN
jgi:non-specific serine/threonine protein kinase/serine/threonine-protein kinase